jgi:hypothetical protein
LFTLMHTRPSRSWSSASFIVTSMDHYSQVVKVSSFDCIIQVIESRRLRLRALRYAIQMLAAGSRIYVQFEKS